MKKEPQKYYITLTIMLILSMIATIIFGIWYMWQDAAKEQQEIKEFQQAQ